MKVKRHISVNIKFLLAKTDIELGQFFQMDGEEARAELTERSAKGELLIGSSNCKGFNPKTGCPGHKP